MIRADQIKTDASATDAKTMEQHFQYLQQLIARAKVPDSCDLLSVSYDPSDGHLLQYSWSNVKKGLQDAVGGMVVKTFQRD